MSRKAISVYSSMLSDFSMLFPPSVAPFRLTYHSYKHVVPLIFVSGRYMALMCRLLSGG